jgi:hypothetical protein
MELYAIAIKYCKIKWKYYYKIENIKNKGRKLLAGTGEDDNIFELLVLIY